MSDPPVLVNDAQDLVGAIGNWVNTGAQPLPAGLSDLVSDGTQDYVYLDPGRGSAPVAGYNPTSSRATYLASDDLGSVRLATDPSDLVIGAGAYDAWGNVVLGWKATWQLIVIGWHQNAG